MEQYRISSILGFQTKLIFQKPYNYSDVFFSSVTSKFYMEIK